MDLFQLYNRNIDYNVRIINLNKETKALSFNFPNVSHSELTKKDKYKGANRNREIMFRPNDKRFILADFDNNPSQTVLNNVKKMGAFLIICSSKNHYQAWFYAPNVKTWEDYTIYAKYICYKFGADIGSTKKGQIGRVPGYINRKKDRNDYKIHIKWSLPKSKYNNLPKLKIDRRELSYSISTTSSVISKKHKEKRKKQKDGDDKDKTYNESNQLPPSEANDWAFLCHIRDNDPRFNTMTREDFMNVLIDIQRSGMLVDLDYLGRTVDNFLRLNPR